MKKNENESNTPCPAGTTSREVVLSGELSPGERTRRQSIHDVKQRRGTPSRGIWIVFLSGQGCPSSAGASCRHIFVTPRADCAEDFQVRDAATIEPGTVLVIDEAGGLRRSRTAYDRRVAGVVSGVGGLRPGIVLDKQTEASDRRPVALVGKVFCKVDAAGGAIAIGDLLTTSDTPGHAMRVGDPSRAFGAVIGKALAPLAAGRGVVPILVALQ